MQLDILSRINRTGTIVKNQLPKDAKFSQDKTIAERSRTFFHQAVNVIDGVYRWRKEGIDKEPFTFTS